jgi:hypothetical protein
MPKAWRDEDMLHEFKSAYLMKEHLSFFFIPTYTCKK